MDNLVLTATELPNTLSIDFRFADDFYLQEKHTKKYFTKKIFLFRSKTSKNTAQILSWILLRNRTILKRLAVKQNILVSNKSSRDVHKTPLVHNTNIHTHTHTHLYFSSPRRNFFMLFWNFVTNKHTKGAPYTYTHTRTHIRTHNIT